MLSSMVLAAVLGTSSPSALAVNAEPLIVQVAAVVLEPATPGNNVVDVKAGSSKKKKKKKKRRDSDSNRDSDSDSDSDSDKERDPIDSADPEARHWMQQMRDTEKEAEPIRELRDTQQAQLDALENNLDNAWKRYREVPLQIEGLRQLLARSGAKMGETARSDAAREIRSLVAEQDGLREKIRSAETEMANKRQRLLDQMDDTGRQLDILNMNYHAYAARVADTMKPVSGKGDGYTLDYFVHRQGDRLDAAGAAVARAANTPGPEGERALKLAAAERAMIAIDLEDLKRLRDSAVSSDDTGPRFADVVFEPPNEDSLTAFTPEDLTTEAGVQNARVGLGIRAAAGRAAINSLNDFRRTMELQKRVTDAEVEQLRSDARAETNAAEKTRLTQEGDKLQAVSDTLGQRIDNASLRAETIRAGIARTETAINDAAKTLSVELAEGTLPVSLQDLDDVADDFDDIPDPPPLRKKVWKAYTDSAVYKDGRMVLAWGDTGAGEADGFKDADDMADDAVADEFEEIGPDDPAFKDAEDIDDGTQVFAAFDPSVVFVQSAKDSSDGFVLRKGEVETVDNPAATEKEPSVVWVDSVMVVDNEAVMPDSRKVELVNADGQPDAKDFDTAMEDMAESLAEEMDEVADALEELDIAPPADFDSDPLNSLPPPGAARINVLAVSTAQTVAAREKLNTELQNEIAALLDGMNRAIDAGKAEMVDGFLTAFDKRKKAYDDNRRRLADLSQEAALFKSLQTASVE